MSWPILWSAAVCSGLRAEPLWAQCRRRRSPRSPQPIRVKVKGAASTRRGSQTVSVLIDVQRFPLVRWTRAFDCVLSRSFWNDAADPLRRSSGLVARDLQPIGTLAQPRRLRQPIRRLHLTPDARRVVCDFLWPPVTSPYVAEVQSVLKVLKLLSHFLCVCVREWVRVFYRGFPERSLILTVDVSCRFIYSS